MVVYLQLDRQALPCLLKPVDTNLFFVIRHIAILASLTRRATGAMSVSRHKRLARRAARVSSFIPRSHCLCHLGFGKCRLYRVYKALGLNLKRKSKRRLPARIKAPLSIPTRTNAVWSADFMSDALWSGPRFRTFNVMDDFNRELLHIEIDTSLPCK